MQRILLSWILLSLTSGWAAGQVAKPVVEARMLMATDAAHPNAVAKAAIVVRVAPGYHINDHHPSLDYLIPTEFKPEPASQVALVNVVYPKGTAKKLAFSDAPLSVYEGVVTFEAELRVGRAVPAGVYTVRGKLAYQACNDHACLPPAAASLLLEVKVVPRGVPLKRVNADVFERIQSE